MGLPQIDGGDALVGDDLLDRALREHLAEMQHGHALRDLAHESSCRARSRARSCRPRSAAAPSRRSACVSSGDMPAVGSSSSSSRGFRLIAMPISSHCFWPWLRLPAVCIWSASQVEERQQPVDLARELHAAVLPLQGDFEILTDRQSLEHTGHLELDRQAAMNARERFQRGDVLAGEEDIAAAGTVLAKDQAEQACSCRRRSGRSGNGFRRLRARG